MGGTKLGAQKMGGRVPRPPGGCATAADANTGTAVATKPDCRLQSCSLHEKPFILKHAKILTRLFPYIPVHYMDVLLVLLLRN
jgi:hypothetical protein